MFRQLTLVIVGLLWSMPMGLADTPSPPNASVYIISPSDGDVVSSPVTVQFGLRGMGIAPAGVDMEMTGHHHLVVDRETPPLDDYLPVGEADVIHYGMGQTETELTLEPGEHTLQLVLGDKDHKPHIPPVVSEIVTITVE